MGNNASQSGNVAQRQQLEQEQHWAHSFPRTPQRLTQHKVLPDVSGDIHQKLRPTNNGEILYSGGTISGRHHSSSLSLPREDVQNGVCRSSSISSKHPQENFQQRHMSSYQRDQTGRSSPRRSRNIPVDLQHPHGNHNQRELQMKRFGSVPDLRGRDAVDHVNREPREHASRTRKKYKAPAPPANQQVTNSSSLDSWDMNMNGEINDTPIRRTRLFKTRAEMKKKAPSPQNYRRSMDSHPRNNIHNDETKRYRSRSREPQQKTSETKVDEISRNEKNKKPNGYRMPLSEMQRSKSLPEFQAELREATKKLRSTKYKQEEKNSPMHYKLSEQNNKNNVQNYKAQDSKEHKLKTLDPNVVKKEHIKYKMRQVEKSYNKDTSHDSDTSKSTNNNVATRPSNLQALRGRAVGKESTPERSPPQKVREKPDSKELPAKTFYFGMDDSDQPNSFNSNVIDHFAQSIQKQNCALPPQAYSGSDLSSEIDIDDSQTSTNGIALHLRPILPKKQLEIPRFSPAAAWRLLSAFDSNPPPSTVSDEGPVMIEDRIEKFARQPLPLSIPGIGPRSNHDKSGDSGISGDAGPPGFDDNTDPILSNARNNNLPVSTSHGAINLSWTPQQDLEGEESNSEGGLNNNNNNRVSYMRSTTNIKFSPRSQVFSLSLPRDNHLAAYMEEKARQHSPPSYTNLQRLKRSVSGVLGNFGNKKDSHPTVTQDQNDNWFLSRSAPNSLNNGFNSLELRLSRHNNMVSDFIDDQSPLVPNNSHTNGGRVIYLPECKENNKSNIYPKNENEETFFKSDNRKDTLDNIPQNVDMCNNNDVNKNSYRLSGMSKSCENISSNVNKLPFEPEDLQDPPPIKEDKWKGRKPKRFTFQSTVRQIERRRLAEKLSREAERKEQQRLSELEAMRRVEEEFQRKRAKEKASIRQQLRLFSLEDTVWPSLPSNWDNKDEVPTRSEPDGAVSSSASSPILDSPTKLDSKTTNNDLDHNDLRHDNFRKNLNQKHFDKSSPTFKPNIVRQGSESSDDTRVKAQATQVLSEYRQPRREYKDYRTSSRLVDVNDMSYHNDTKQTKVYPQVTYNMPKAHGHQGSSDGSSRSNNYRRDFAHGIMLPGRSSETYSDDSQSNIRKHSPRISQNQRTRQGKCIS